MMNFSSSGILNSSVIWENEGPIYKKFFDIMIPLFLQIFKLESNI